MMKMHSYQKGSSSLYFLEIHDKLAGNNAYDCCILPILENVCTEERNTKHKPRTLCNAG